MPAMNEIFIFCLLKLLVPTEKGLFGIRGLETDPTEWRKGNEKMVLQQKNK